MIPDRPYDPQDRAPQKATNATHEMARALIEAGISIIPIGKNKRPAGFLLPRDENDPEKPTWKPFQTAIATQADVDRWFSGATPKAGIARVHGKVSGNLETIDFDCPDDVVTDWERLVEDQAPGLVAKLTKIRTPRPGTQYSYRCESPVDGNQILAQVLKAEAVEHSATPATANNGDWDTLIETRGEGGYAVCPETPLWCHPNGKPYEHVGGPPLTNIRVITGNERHVLLAAARMFNQKPDRQVNEFTAMARAIAVGGKRPGDEFNQRVTWAEILEPHGWVRVSEAQGVDYWKRPGGQSQWSATTNYAGNDLFHVFSTNAGLESGKSYSKFAVYTHLNHEGDYHAATRALSSKGFGSTPSYVNGSEKATGSGSNTQGKPKLKRPDATPWIPFPVDVLPDVPRRFVIAAAKAIGCDPAFIALPVLAVSASAIGNSREAFVKHNWREPAILWCPIIADSGSQKSPALRTVMKSIFEVQNIALREYAERMKCYEVAKQNFDAAVKEWQRKGQKKPEPQPEPPPIAVCRRSWVSDVTIEGLAPILQENPRGVLMYREELSGWFGSFDQYKGNGKGGDVGHWLSMYGGDPMLFDRKTDRVTIHVPRAAVCVVGSIQPRIIARCLGSEHFENGMAARLMPAFPPKRPRVWTEADVDPTDEEALARMFASLYDIPVNVDENGTPKPVAIRMDSSAYNHWTKYYNAHGKLQAELTGDLAAAASKLEGGAVRLALVLQLMRDPNSVTIDAESMSAGITLAKWFQNEVQRVYAVLAETPDQAEARKVGEWIGRRGSATARDLTQCNRRYKGDPEGAEKFMDAMVDAGMLVSSATTPGGKGGRPTTVYRLSPVYETHSTLEENGGFVDNAETEVAEIVGDDEIEEGEFDDCD